MRMPNCQSFADPRLTSNEFPAAPLGDERFPHGGSRPLPAAMRGPYALVVQRLGDLLQRIPFPSILLILTRQP